MCGAEADGDREGGNRNAQSSVPLSRINDSVGRRVVRGAKLFFPIDCLIAPVAVCRRPLAKSIIIFVAKVRLGRCPYRSPF